MTNPNELFVVSEDTTSGKFSYKTTKDRAEEVCKKYGDDVKVATLKQLCDAYGQNNTDYPPYFPDWCSTAWVRGSDKVDGTWPKICDNIKEDEDAITQSYYATQKPYTSKITGDYWGTCHAGPGIVHYNPGKANVTCYGVRPMKDEETSKSILPWNKDGWSRDTPCAYNFPRCDKEGKCRRFGSDGETICDTTKLDKKTKLPTACDPGDDGCGISTECDPSCNKPEGDPCDNAKAECSGNICKSIGDNGWDCGPSEKCDKPCTQPDPCDDTKPTCVEGKCQAVGSDGKTICQSSTACTESCSTSSGSKKYLIIVGIILLVILLAFVIYKYAGKKKR